MDMVRELSESADSKATIESLIFMVSDPEPRISQQADQALRRIMSRPDGIARIDHQSVDSKTIAMMKWYELYFSRRGITVTAIKSEEVEKVR